MSAKSATSGLSLIEVVIALSLFGVLAGLLAQILLPVLRAQIRGASRSDLQLEAALALDHLARDMRAGSASAMRVRQNPAMVSVTRLDTVLPDGQQSWEDRVVAYYCEGQSLVRQTWPPGASLGVTPGRGSPTVLSADQLLQLARSPGPARQTLARDVQELDLARSDDHLEVVLHLSRQDAHQSQPETFQLRRVVWLRNG